MTGPADFQALWLNGWQRTPQGWMLEAVGRRDGEALTRLLPAAWLEGQQLAFEPSRPPFSRLATSSLRLQIADLSQLSPLLYPGRLLRPLLPTAKRTRQAIYTVQHEGQRLFLPASLVLPQLWLWTAGTLQPLLTPNSLALDLACSGARPMHVHTRGALGRLGTSDTTLRRLCWLAQCGSAQASWASVLTYAHEGRLELRLPRASLDAWVRTVELPTGLLIAEWWAVKLSFELPHPDCMVHMGAAAARRCPPAPEPRTGLVSF
jgi:hypothetical protein